MANTEVIVRFDGPDLTDHKMEIEQIAPSMLALSQLVKRANYLANGESSSVRVFARANVEQHCFEFGFEIVQSILTRTKTLLGDEDVKTAKEIAEWIGIIGSSSIGFLGLLKLMKGRQPDEITLVVEDGENRAKLEIDGDDVLVDPMAAKLMQDRESVKNAKAATQPLEQEGYDSLEFQDTSGNIEKFDKAAARSIRDYPDPEVPIASEIPASHVRAWVSIRKAVYVGTGKWTIQYDRAREVTVNDMEWLSRFQSNEIEAPPGSLIDVDMYVSSIPLDRDGRPIKEPEYSIMKVYDVRLPERQTSMFD